MKTRHTKIMSSVTALLTSLLLSAYAVASSAQGFSHAFNDPGRGELLLQTGSDWQPAIQLGTRVDMQVSGLVARVTVEQRFRNTRPEWADGRYVFPLPATAAVAEMRIEVDGRVIVGEIREKEAAEQVFREAQQAGKRAALLEQSRPNLFRTRLANLGPDQEISVTLTYLEKVHYDQGEFSLRFPMTITERFEPGARPRAEEHAEARAPSEREFAAAASVAPDGNRPLQPVFALAGVPRNPVQITASIDAGVALAEVASPYHAILSEASGNIHRVALANNHGRDMTPMDRDFVLRWRPAPSDAPRAALFAEELAGATYALLMVMPPSAVAAPERLPREVIFVVDRSGSMGGVSIEAARQALGSALTSLARTDRFNIISFDDSTRQLFAEAQFADGGYLQDGWEFVQRLEAGGGTVMEPALRAALRNQRRGAAGYVRQVVFITDGAVGNDDELLRIIDSNLGKSRLFTVGIGSAPNNHFMRKAAQYGRGSFTHIAHPGEAAGGMTDLFAKLEAPVLTGLSVGWSAQAEQFPARVPDLYAGEPLVVTARLSDSGGPLVAGIRDANGQWQQNVRLDTPGAHAGVATLWARDKLEWLYDRITETGDADGVRPAIVALGLQHQLVSRYTSFVAVEQTPVRPAGAPVGDQQVPNALPAGQVLALPQTDAGTYLSLFTGGLCLLAAWLLRMTGRRRWQA